MDDSDVRESFALQNHDKLNEETLKIALDINESLGRKGKTFKSFKPPKSLTNDAAQTIVADTPRVQITILDRETTSLPSTIPTTLKAEYGNEYEKYEDRDETTLTNAELNSNTESREIATEITTENRIEGKELQFARNKFETSFKNAREKLPNNLRAPVLQQEIKNHGTTLNTSSEHTTVIPEENSSGFEKESLKKFVTHKIFSNVDRPLITTTTNKPYFATERPKIGKEVGLESNGNEQNSAERHFETATPRSILARNHPQGSHKFKSFKTTTVNSLKSIDEIGSVDSTTEQLPQTEFPTRRSYSRLIRYGTTTPSTDETDEEEKIESTTVRSFGRQKLNTLTQRRPFVAISRSKNPAIRDTKPNPIHREISSKETSSTRPAYKRVISNRYPVNESFERNRHLTTTTESNMNDVSTEEEYSTLRNDEDAVASTSPLTDSDEGEARYAEADISNANADNTEENNIVSTTSRTTGGPIESVTLTYGETDVSEMAMAEMLTTEELFTLENMPTTSPYEGSSYSSTLVTENNDRKTYVTLKPPEVTTTNKRLPSVIETNSVQSETSTIPFTNTTAAADVDGIRENERLHNRKVLSDKDNLSTGGPLISQTTTSDIGSQDTVTQVTLEENEDKNESLTEEQPFGLATNEKINFSNSLRDKENSFSRIQESTNKQILTTEKPFQSIEQTIDLLESADESMVESGATISVNEDVATERILAKKKPTEGNQRITTNSFLKVDEESKVTVETDVNISLNEGDTTKTNLTTRKPFESNQRTTTVSFRETEDESESTVESDENISAKGDFISKRILATRKPFAGNQGTTTISFREAEDESEGTLERDETISANEDVTTKRILTTQKRFQSFEQNTTINLLEEEEENENGSTTELDANIPDKEEDTTKRILATRKQFEGSQRTTTISFSETEDGRDSTIESDATEADTTKRILGTRKPFEDDHGTTNLRFLDAEKEDETTEHNEANIAESEEIITKYILTTRKPFGNFKRPINNTLQTNMKEETDLVENDKDNVSERPIYARRPFIDFKRISVLNAEKERESIGNNKATNAANVEISTTRFLASGRPFGGFTRPTIKTLQATKNNDENLGENDEDTPTYDSLSRRRPFGAFKRLTSPSPNVRSYTTNNIREHTSATIKQDFDSSIENEEDNKGNVNGFRKHILPSRKPYVSIERHATAIPQDKNKEIHTSSDINKEGLKNLELAKKLSVLTTPRLAHFKRPISTENSVVESITENLQPFVTETSTEQTLLDIEAIQISNDDTTSATYNGKADKEENEETSTIAEEMLDSSFPATTENFSTTHRKVTIRKRIQTTMTPPTNEPTSSEEDFNETTEKEISLSTIIPSEHNQKTINRLSEESRNQNSNPKNVAENEDTITKLQLVKSDTNVYVTNDGNRTSSKEPENNSNVTAEYGFNVDEEEQVTSQVTQTDFTTRRSSSELNSFQTPTEQPENNFNVTDKYGSNTDKEEEEEQTTFKASQSTKGSFLSPKSEEEEKAKHEKATANNIITQRTYLKSYKLQATAESSFSTATEELELGYGSRKNLNRFNRYRATAKHSRPTESSTEKYFLDSEDNSKVSAQRFLGQVRQRQRQRLFPRLHSNKNFSNRNKQKLEEEETGREIIETSQRSPLNNYRPQNDNSNLLRKIETKENLKTFNSNRPYIHEIPDLEEEEEYEEDEETIQDSNDTDDKYREKETILAKQDLAAKEPNSILLNLRKPPQLQQTQDSDPEEGLANHRLKNFLNTTGTGVGTNFNTKTSQSSVLTTEDIDKEVAITTAITSNTNGNRFGSNWYNSTVANYLNKIKTNLSKINTNSAPSHINHDNEDKFKLDIDNVDEEYDHVKSKVSTSNKSKVKANNYNVYKGDDYDNDSKRRFQKYQFQRRTTTTTTTTTTTAAPLEADADNEAAKTQVNLNDAYESARQTSTNIPETTAPITTERPSLPATPLQRRIKVIKLKRPLVSKINVTVNNAIASSATNSNASHTETPNIVKLSISEVESPIVKNETLTNTETEITETQTPIPSQTSARTPKLKRKIIRKLIRPVHNNTQTTNATVLRIENFNSTKIQSANRFAFNRNPKFRAVEDEGEEKIEELTKRARNRFTLPNDVASAARNRYKSFGSAQPPSSTTERSTPTDNNAKHEDDVDNEDDKEEITNSSSTTTNGFKFTTPLSTTTESSSDIKEHIETTSKTEMETTTSLNDMTTLTVEQEKELLNDPLKSIESKHKVAASADPLLKLRNRVQQDLVKVNQEEGILSTRFKSNKSAIPLDDTPLDDPLLRLRNKVKQELVTDKQVEGILSDHLKGIKNETEVDDPLLKLRNKVKQELAKTNAEEGVVSVKLKKLLETKNTSSTLNYKVNDEENESSVIKDNLNLQKIHDRVQTDLAKHEQNPDAVNSSLKKIPYEKNNSTRLHSSDDDEDNEYQTATELADISENGDLLEESVTPSSERKPFIGKTKLSTSENEEQTQVPTTSAARGRPTFRRKLIAKRPYIPTKSPLASLSTSTKRIYPTKAKSKYERPTAATFHPLNANNRNAGEGLLRTYPRNNKLAGSDRFKIDESSGGQKDEDKEYDEEEVEQTEEEHKGPIFDRPQTTIVKRPTNPYKEQGSGYNEAEVNGEEEEEDDEEDDESDDEDEEEDEEENENESIPETDIIDSNPASYRPIDNRIPPGARPALNTTPTIKKPFTPKSRVPNTPYRPGGLTSTPRNKANRFPSTFKTNAKHRVVNRPLGVAVPTLTIKPVATDFERTTVLIPTKPAPFINPNTRAYERKYTGPTTESFIDSNSDSNPLIEDLNIEALNARNKKIFDIHSKKHTTLKPKVIIPLAKQNEHTQELQPERNTELETHENMYDSSVNGFATTPATTTSITLNTNTQQQEHVLEQSTTLDNTTIGTQNTDDANPSNVNNLNEISPQDGFTTIQPPTTTLLHIFTLADGGHTTESPLQDGNHVVPRLLVERIKPKHKVVEINRIVEVNSKEEKLRRKSKANTIIPIAGSQTYKVESLPHVEQLGEISVVKYVHQVDGSDITIEGRSTVTDYTPTEPSISAEVSQPTRQSLPEGSAQVKRYGKALLPEVIREAMETSTISLEGLFETARKGKVLNTIEDVEFAPQEDIISTAHVREIKSTTQGKTVDAVETATETSLPMELSTESFNILKSLSFDIAKINLEPQESKEYENNNNDLKSTSLNSSSTIDIPSSVTTPAAPEILSKESTTVPTEDPKATTVAAALFPHYLRTPATVNSNGSTATRRPVLSVRRRLINSFNAAAATTNTQQQQQQQQQQTTTASFTTPSDSSSTINDEYTITTSRFKRLRTNRPPPFNSAAVDITSDTTAATSFKTNNKLKKKSTETLSNDLKLASSTLTSTSSADNDITSKQIPKAQSSVNLRRKFQARRLTTSTASNTDIYETATEPPRTQNPLFKRRYSLTTYSPLSVKTGQQTSKTAAPTATTISSSSSPVAAALQTAAIDSLTTTVYVDGLENDEAATDQVAKSSIHTSRFNQINGRLHIDDDDEEELDTAGISRIGNNSVKKFSTTLSSASRQQHSPLNQIQYSKFHYDDVITRRMDDAAGIVANHQPSTSTVDSTTSATTAAPVTSFSPTTVTQAPVIKQRKMIIKRKPQKATPSSEESLAAKRRRPHHYQEPFERINRNPSKAVVKTSTQPGRTYRPTLDYDYYDDEDVRLVGNKKDQQLKVILHGGGIIECLDQGNFPHPLSCRKFISCAKFETGGVVGWEYTCPKGLSYDPVGGMCNWAAGLGCKE